MRISDMHWLKNATIAHRGLHDDTHPENSMSAFLYAMEKGLPIEIDVHLTTDGEVIIFHDHNAKRVCGVDVDIENCTYEETQQLRLEGSEEKIPLLTDLLKVAKTPILIELKNLTTHIGPLEEATYNILKDYKGEYAVQSFNPFSLRWYRKHAPQILRGQLASFFSFKPPNIRNYILKAMKQNKRVRPDFISYDERFLPNKYVDKYVRKHPKVVKIAWTVRSKKRQEELIKTVSSVIFENYIP